jgi:hypothetical protein
VTARTATRDRHAARRWLLLSVLGLVLAWIVAPAVVPIYDGIGNPDEPYRFVKPPPGVSAGKPPTTAKVTLPVHNGVSEAGYANSAENAPQVSLYLPSGALGVSASATSVIVTAQPQAPSSPTPSDGTIASNVYRIAASAGGQAAPVKGTGNQAPTLQMRAPSAQQPGPVFERVVNGKWTDVRTLRVGNDIYQTQLSGFGDWALVQPNGTITSGSSGGGGVKLGLLIPGIAVLVLAAVIGTVRAVRLRQVAR